MIKEQLLHFVILILSLIMAALQNETIKIQKSIFIYLMYMQYSPQLHKLLVKSTLSPRIRVYLSILYDSHGRQQLFTNTV